MGVRSCAHCVQCFSSCLFVLAIFLTLISFLIMFMPQRCWRRLMNWQRAAWASVPSCVACAPTRRLARAQVGRPCVLGGSGPTLCPASMNWSTCLPARCSAFDKECKLFPVVWFAEANLTAVNRVNTADKDIVGGEADLPLLHTVGGLLPYCVQVGS